MIVNRYKHYYRDLTKKVFYIEKLQNILHKYFLF